MSGLWKQLSKWNKLVTGNRISFYCSQNDFGGRGMASAESICYPWSSSTPKFRRTAFEPLPVISVRVAGFYMWIWIPHVPLYASERL